MSGRMGVNGAVWSGVLAIFLSVTAATWAMEKGEASGFTPQQLRMHQLLTTERVIDSNPAASVVSGNSVVNLQRWNAILLRESHQQLRLQGPGRSPDGEIVSPRGQKIELKVGRMGQ